MYAKRGLLATVFDKLPTPDVVLWNALIAGYAVHGFSADALNCLNWMQHDGTALNSVTLICSVKACGTMKAIVKGCELHTQIIKRGYEKESYVGSTLVDMYGKYGLLGEAQNVLDTLLLENVVPQNALIAGYAQHKCGEEDLDYFTDMQCYGAPMNAATYVRSLKACGSLGAVVKGEEIHAEASRRGLEIDLIVGSSLVDMYVKCGLLAEAQGFFANLLVRDLLLWNALITGYSQLGESGHAFDAFFDMTCQGHAFASGYCGVAYRSGGLGDVELGLHVFENALLLDNNDVEACVSMFNICMNAFAEEAYKAKALEL